MSPGTTAAPRAARTWAWDLVVSRVRARTCQPSANRRRATAPPCWPVAPVTAIVLLLMLLSPILYEIGLYRWTVLPLGRPSQVQPWRPCPASYTTRPTAAVRPG